MYLAKKCVCFKPNLHLGGTDQSYSSEQPVYGYKIKEFGGSITQAPGNSRGIQDSYLEQADYTEAHFTAEVLVWFKKNFFVRAKKQTINLIGYKRSLPAIIQQIAFLIFKV